MLWVKEMPPACTHSYAAIKSMTIQIIGPARSWYLRTVFYAPRQDHELDEPQGHERDPAEVRQAEEAALLERR